VPFLSRAIRRTNCKVSNLRAITTSEKKALATKRVIAAAGDTPESVKCPHNRLALDQFGKSIERGVETMKTVDVKQVVGTVG